MQSDRSRASARTNTEAQALVLHGCGGLSKPPKVPQLVRPVGPRTSDKTVLGRAVTAQQQQNFTGEILSEGTSEIKNKQRTSGWAPRGLGHGSKKFAKMVFAPRLPQAWRGGGEIALSSWTLLMYRQAPAMTLVKPWCPLQSQLVDTV